jgi:heavy metal sensor kinase
MDEMSVGDNKYRIQVAAPMDDFYEALDRFKWVVLLLSPLLVLLASVGGYWLSRRALAPVDQIMRAAHEINSSNLSKRLEVPRSGDELQRLSETLNGMLERLEDSFSRITQFTADASHELRTPLAVMRTTTEVSLRTSQSISDYREAQAEILEELEKTSALVEKLMLLARADAGVETLQRGSMNLADSLKEACDDGRILAQAKQLTFQENISTSTMVVDGDSHALHRLFLILIDNAVKYTPSGGSITVSLNRSDKSAVAEVHDNGVGIATGDLPHIFDRFYRADKARSREFGGVGLGLSIARWVAEAHGGSVEVHSSVGTGSIFRVRIPLLDV